MGIADTGCLNHVPYGYGALRSYDGRCHYYRDNQHIRLNFKMKEFNPRRIHPYGIMEKLVDDLQKMRSHLGVPIFVTSGYRREANPHGSGLAADITVPRKSFIQVTEAAYYAGFRRIEVMKRYGTSYWNLMSVGGHIHVDVYDGSGNNYWGTEYDCPTCDKIPCYPWYAWGIQNSWSATCHPNTFAQLIHNLKSNAHDTGYRGC